MPMTNFSASQSKAQPVMAGAGTSAHYRNGRAVRSPGLWRRVIWNTFWAGLQTVIFVLTATFAETKYEEIAGKAS